MKPILFVAFQLVVIAWALVAHVRRDPSNWYRLAWAGGLRRSDRARRLVPLDVRVPGRLQLLTPAFRARITSVSPGQSQNTPSGERAASNSRTSAAKSSARSPNRWGAENDDEK